MASSANGPCWAAGLSLHLIIHTGGRVVRARRASSRALRRIASRVMRIITNSCCAMASWWSWARASKAVAFSFEYRRRASANSSPSFNLTSTGSSIESNGLAVGSSFSSMAERDDDEDGDRPNTVEFERESAEEVEASTVLSADGERARFMLGETRQVHARACGGCVEEGAEERKGGYAEM
ncbi:hypothetical protein, unknown function [Leishmania tarentolae]|uniref:Uncharacterized protein n=1 Tax=Leishmania tarentolae TaxID=5689 RepID=A0A640K6R4_LEITA|nr:hypothetical protein, unknown function [Leishmania tarentolae]